MLYCALIFNVICVSNRIKIVQSVTANLPFPGLQWIMNIIYQPCIAAILNYIFPHIRWSPTCNTLSEKSSSCDNVDDDYFHNIVIIYSSLTSRNCKVTSSQQLAITVSSVSIKNPQSHSQLTLSLQSDYQWRMQDSIEGDARRDWDLRP